MTARVYLLADSGDGPKVVRWHPDRVPGEAILWAAAADLRGVPHWLVEAESADAARLTIRVGSAGPLARMCKLGRILDSGGAA